LQQQTILGSRRSNEPKEALSDIAELKFNKTAPQEFAVDCQIEEVRLRALWTNYNGTRIAQIS
jgi:hypothetical protein